MGLAIFRNPDSPDAWKGLYAISPVYLTAHNAADAGFFTLWVGNDFWGGNYRISRACLHFLTNSLGGAPVIGAKLCLPDVNIKHEDDVGYSDVHIVEGVHHIPVELSDYGLQLSKTISGGFIAYADISVPNTELNIIILNTDGLAWVNPSATTKLCLRLNSDINAWVPSGEYNIIRMTTGGHWDAVVTLPASNIAANSATLNGRFRGNRNPPPYLEVSYVGDNPTFPRVRFQYGLTTTYGNDTPWQYGTPMFTDYSADIMGLLPDTKYHFRAQYEDDIAYENGDDKTFTTTGAPPVAYVINKAYALDREEL